MMKKNNVFQKQCSRKASIAQGGFTLIEFVVIISIFAIVAGIGFFNIRGFQADISVTNLSHDLALLIRRAQSEGTAALSQNGITQPIPRGIMFTYDQGTSSFTQDLIVFDDRDQSGTYDVTQDLDPIDTIQIQTDDKIASVEYQDAAGVWTSVSAPFAITFKRPFPEPIFSDSSWQGVKFHISRPDGTLMHTVTLSGFGEIAVQ